MDRLELVTSFKNNGKNLQVTEKNNEESQMYHFVLNFGYLILVNLDYFLSSHLLEAF